MKKHIIFESIAICFLMTAVIFTTSCKSTPIVISEQSPMAVIGVTGNYAVPWDEEKNQNDDVGTTEGNGVLSDTINKMLDKDNPELVSSQDRLDYAAQTLHELISTNAGIEIIDHDKLLESKTYSSTMQNILNSLTSIKTATGYKFVTGVGAKRARMIMSETGAKSLLVVQFKFQKKNTKGTHWSGKVCGTVTMTARLYNNKGKEILNQDYYAMSADEFQISKFKYDKQALVDSYSAVIDAVINQFIVSFVQ